jgi:hypothetical protein
MPDLAQEIEEYNELNQQIQGKLEEVQELEKERLQRLGRIQVLNELRKDTIDPDEGEKTVAEEPESQDA